MKYLMLLFLIPYAFADSPPGCSELGRIMQNYEVDLQRKGIKNCSSVSIQNEIIKGASVSGSDLISTHICSDLSTIESQLERLKNKDAILSGIAKLKANIEASKAGAGNANLPEAQAHGTTFVNSLNTAQSLELLLESKTQDDSSFIAELKNMPPDRRRSYSDFKGAIRELCKVREAGPGVIDACDSNSFNPDEASIKELNALIDQAEDAPAQISSWREQLRIQKIPKTDDQEINYSFTQMRREMESAFSKIDRKDKLSREELRAIQGLDRFQNASGLSHVENIAAARDQLKPLVAADKFRFLVEDSTLRQKHEVMSKTSQFYAGLDQTKLATLPEVDKGICGEAKVSYEKALACHHILKEKADPTLRSNKQFNEFLDAMAASNTYINKLYGVSEACLENIKNGTIENSCLNEFTSSQAEVKDQILQLHLLKEKIGSENRDLMHFRNFALQKYGSQRCAHKDSSIEFCGPETEQSISPKASLLTNQVMSISIMMREAVDKAQHADELAQTENAVENLCDDEDKIKKTSEERLCAFFNDTTSNVIQTINHEKENVDGPVSVSQRPSTAVRDAWIGGATNILNDLTNFYASKNTSQQQMNPYPYNFSPYNAGAGPRGVADTVLFNALHHGAYTLYIPTPGLTPYTAFGPATSMMTPYSALPATRGSYFGR